MQKQYQAVTRPDLVKLRPPRRDLLRNRYFVQTMQTSRGCPHNCKFCSVTRFNGGQYRMRDIDMVVKELDSIPEKRLFIIDDNIIGSGKTCTRRALALFDAMRGCDKEWGGQTCLNIVENRELLQAAAAAGAKAFLIGFESIREEVLSGMNKNMNLRPNTRNFNDSIKIIQDQGIAVIGGFIFGSDQDTPDTFRSTLDFIFSSGIDAVQLSIQTPLPGTVLYQELAQQGRLSLTSYPDDWESYNIFEPVFEPKNISREELYNNLIEAYRQVASIRRSLPRGLKTLWRTRSLFSTGISFFWNHDSYKSIRSMTRPYRSFKS
jgi:radical SAM superfamily enzyme YgiQ (UPF0313 family)